MRMIKKIIIGLLKVCLGVALFFGVVIYAPLWYFAKPANDFCKDIHPEVTSSEVIQKAKENNYRAFNNIKNNNGHVLVETQDMPLFRMGCKITFKDSKMVSKVVISTD
jgi:hypothetical protein